MNNLVLNLLFCKNKNNSIYGFFRLPNDIKNIIEEGMYIFEIRSTTTDTLLLSRPKKIIKPKSKSAEIISISYKQSATLKHNLIYKVVVIKVCDL